MEELIYIILYVITEFSNYILGYTVIFRKKTSANRRSLLLAVFGLLLFHSILWKYYGLYDAAGPTILTMAIIPLLLVKPFEWVNLLLYPIVVTGTSTFSVASTFLFATITKQPNYIVKQELSVLIVSQGIPIVLMLLIYLYRKLSKVQMEKLQLNWKQYVIFYFSCISLMFIMGSIQTLSELEASQMTNFAGVSSSIACIMLIIVMVWQANVQSKEEVMRNRNAENERNLKLQKEYYESLMERDEEIRRFRHDMNAHIQMLSTYCEKDENRAVRDYLNKMVEESSIYGMESYTGNNEMDAIIRTLIVDAEKRKIQFRISGSFPQVSGIEPFDLCTIVYNLLKNAIEACDRIEDKEKCIVMEVGSLNSQKYIMVKNTIDKDVTIGKNKKLATSKPDKRNHGIGTQNIMRAVDKYNGTYEVSNKDGWFITEINFLAI